MASCDHCSEMEEVLCPHIRFLCMASSIAEFERPIIPGSRTLVADSTSGVIGVSLFMS